MGHVYQSRALTNSANLPHVVRVIMLTDFLLIQVIYIIEISTLVKIFKISLFNRSTTEAL